MSTPKKLTAMREKFVDEFLVDLNATQAAIRAGYCKKGANGSASRLLSNVIIKEEIAKRQAKRINKLEIDKNYVLKRHIEIDNLDVLDIITDDHTFKPLSQWSKAWRTSLSGIDLIELGGSDINTGTVKKIKWPDKIKNLELLGKHIDIQAYRERVDLEVDATMVPFDSIKIVDE